MSLSINAKREQIRVQIRKKQRQNFFLSERLKMSNFSHRGEIGTLINNFKQKSQLQSTFKQATRIIESPNFYPDTMKMVEQGLICLMISFLRQKIHVKQSLEIVSYLLQKFSIKQHCLDVYERLYNGGIFEILIEFVKLKQLSSLSVFIFCKFAEAREDYCESLIVGQSYKILISQFLSRSQQCRNAEEDNQSEDRFFTYILSTLENIISIKESALDFEEEREYIMGFIVQLLKRRLFLRPVLGIFYEYIKSSSKPKGQFQIQIINQLASQATPDCNYLQNLMATVYLLAPSKLINYSRAFQAAIRVPKMYKIVSYIFQKLIDAGFTEQIPTREDYWQKLMIGCNDEPTFKRLLKITVHLTIDKDLMWRILGTAIESTSLGIQKQGIQILSNRITTTDNVSTTLFSLSKYKITTTLNALCHSKNQTIQLRANSLLGYILGPLTEMGERLQ